MPLSRLSPPSRQWSDRSIPLTPFATLGISGPLGEGTNDRDTPLKRNCDVHAWLAASRLNTVPDAHGGNNGADPESGFDDTASEHTVFSASPTADISIDENDIVVAVMGPTGAGKSTFIDRAVGRPDINAGHDLTSCTKEVRAVRYPHTDGTRNIVLVDTPGFDDTFMTDVQVLQRIADWLKSTYEKNVKLSGVLYLHRISDNRVGGTPLRNYKMFKELCGKDNFKNVILVTTMWDAVTEEVGSAREQELHAEFWKAMIALGSTTHRFEGTTESAWKIINSLSVPPLASLRPLQIQWEMVDEHIPLLSTSAGRTVLDSLSDLMSSVKGIFRRFSRGRKKLSSPTSQLSSSPLRRSSSSSTVTSSSSSGVGWSVGTGTISTNSSGTCNVEGYQRVLGQVTSTLRASLGAAESARAHCLKNAIAPSLSLALFIETATGTHHALLQVLQAATLLINVVIDYAKGAKLSADVKTAVSAFAKEMNSVQGIIQSVAQRKPEMRQVLEPMDARIISSCANSMRLVCDVLRSKPSEKYCLDSVDNSLGALKRGLEINNCTCGTSREPMQPVSPVLCVSD